MNQRFYLITLLSTYVFLKEHCKKLENCSSEKRNDNIDKILQLLQPLEAYVHIPDKIDFISKAYDEVELIWAENKKGQEKVFFEEVKKYAKNLKKYEKREILNILIYVVNEDDKISMLEKEFLLQLSSVFEFNEDYKELLAFYEKSPFKKPFSIKKMSVIASLLIIILMVGLYILSKTINSEGIHIFKEEKIMFNKLSFNRFIVYKNKYIIENTHFAKQAVFNINGKAEIGFDPQNINYDPESQTVTYLFPKEAPFIVEVSSKALLIDEANPVPLTEGEAAKMSTGLALAGGLIGAKAGSTIGSLYPNKLVKMGATLSGGVMGSAASGILSFNALNGLQVSENITKKEKALVIKKSKELVKIILTYNDELISMYKQNFKKYIKSKYASEGLIVDKVLFSTNALK
jgi:hypothetical protein